MFDRLIHHYLRVPYALHVRVNRTVKKPQATLLFIHGIGSTGAEWEEVMRHVPDTVSVMTIDLLGFGDSPRPSWATYDAATQARSVIATVLRRRLDNRRLIVVGHSLGALVAIEVAKRYPLLVRSLVLCSPPLYVPESTLPSNDELLKRLYRRFELRPSELISLAGIALKYGLVNKAINITSDNVDTYIATLRASIINQTSLSDAIQLQKRATILYGTLDPLVLGKNIKVVARANPYIDVRTVLAGHEVMGKYVAAVADVLRAHIELNSRVRLKH